MKERPILFKAEMIRALLAGTKTQTRRKGAGLTDALTWFVGDPVTEEQADDVRISFSETGHKGAGWYVSSDDYPDEGSAFARCPYGVVGDRLWVQETWAVDESLDGVKPSQLVPGMDLQYLADGHRVKPHRSFDRGKTRVSIFMPRWASRILLELAGVGVERLQKISEEDARAEGIIEIGGCFGVSQADAWENNARAAYRRLWGEINGAASWDANPWIWKLTFRRVHP